MDNAEKNQVVVVDALYQKSKNPDWHGCVYIEALPQLPSMTDFIHNIEQRIDYDPDYRTHSFERRSEYCLKLLNWFSVDYDHFVLAQEIDRIIRNGYSYRFQRSHVLGDVAKFGLCLHGVSDGGKTKGIIKILMQSEFFKIVVPITEF